MGPEPPPPAWLVAQNLARELSILAEPSGDQGANNNGESRAEEMAPAAAIMNFLNTMTVDGDLEAALEESLQVRKNNSWENQFIWYTYFIIFSALNFYVSFLLHFCTLQTGVVSKLCTTIGFWPMLGAIEKQANLINLLNVLISGL